MGRPKLVKRFNRQVDSNQGKIGGVPHYKTTYIDHGRFQPTQMIKPSPKPRPIYSPMNAQPTTKDIFKNHGSPTKRTPILPKEELELNEGKIEGLTMYKQDFPIKPILPPMLIKKPEANIVQEVSPFDGTTMNNRHYKSWKVQERPRYKELQSFSGPLIFPSKKLYSNKSTTHETHSSLPMDSFQKSEIKVQPDNIRVGEGNIELTTTNNLTYRPNQLVEGQRLLAKGPNAKYKYVIPPKMDCNTKYKSDFGHYTRVPPLKPASPAPTTIELKMDKYKKCGYETEQRKEFHGWDVVKHPRLKGKKLMDNTEVSTDAMQTFTSNKVDFPVRPLSAVRPPIKRPLTNQDVKIAKEKVDYTTSNKAFYKEWKSSSRARHGDFHETHKQNFILPYMKKSESYKTISQSEFIKRECTPRESMKPSHKMAIDTSLQHDFNTTSRMCFQHPPTTAYEIEEIEVIC